MMKYLLIVVLLLVSLPAQQTWIVGCAFPGAHFTDIPDAVATASSGDTILVTYDQSYPCVPNFGYSACVIDKPLTIIGVGNAGGWVPFGGALGLFEVVGIPAGSSVKIVGMRVGAVFAFPDPPPPWGYRIHDCAGRVVLEQCSFVGSGEVGATMEIINCDDVRISNTQIQLGGEPMRITNSNVLMQTSRVMHRPPLPQVFPFFPFQQTAEGMRVIDSTVSLMSGKIIGADEVGLFPYSQWRSRPGATLQNSTIEVGPASVLVGGQALGGGAYLSYFTLPSPGENTVYLDPRGLIPRRPPASSPGTGPQPTPTRINAVLYEPANPGVPFRTLLTGPDNGYAVLGIGTPQDPPLPTAFGDLHLDQQSFAIAACQPLDADGLALATLLPPLGLPVGVRLMLQAMTLDPQGVFELTRPCPLYFAWPTGVAPY